MLYLKYILNYHLRMNDGTDIALIFSVAWARSRPMQRTADRRSALGAVF
jgi:hypothetical protein